ncbi:hypothetical protein [Streptomyces sp. NBC_00239]|uniref:hypothetical protein n=1 Tax=Streptomyces sp. NBC_00239 TaxID=2903640 RepID=UPI002E2CA8F0|nr:hypothetical protein [Streptomyces sp. NBC_00239]
MTDISHSPRDVSLALDGVGRWGMALEEREWDLVAAWVREFVLFPVPNPRLALRADS